ncbi:MAG TPA: hypothetical protein VFJ85_00535 [Acidimicrobiales bacterium]|nr:hypothetical protein [Acidimicrobiales bacterium]
MTDTLDRLAADLDREAAALERRLDAAVAACNDEVWRGPAARRTADGLRAARRRVRAAAAELRRVAALVRRRASDARPLQA